jgi:hypothetical protein
VGSAPPGLVLEPGAPDELGVVDGTSGTAPLDDGAELAEWPGSASATTALSTPASATAPATSQRVKRETRLNSRSRSAGPKRNARALLHGLVNPPQGSRPECSL